MVGLALPAKQYEQVQQIAETSERSMSSVVREALENYLEEHND
jgi:predicted DNA-binding protein